VEEPFVYHERFAEPGKRAYLRMPLVLPLLQALMTSMNLHVKGKAVTIIAMR